MNPQGYGIRPNAFLESVANRIPAGSHLYVPGDGYGRNGLWLARRGYRITLADLSTVGIEAANRRAAEENLDLTVTVADVSSFDPGEIDAAVLIYLHLAPEPRQRFHALV